MRRTPQEIAELDHRMLSNWQLFKLTLVCEHTSVAVPSEATRIRRSLIGLSNFIYDKPRLGWKWLCTNVVLFVVVYSSYLLARGYESYGLPDNFVRYLPLSIVVIGLPLLFYASMVAWLSAGGGELVVESYKERMAEKAARRTAQPD